MNYRFDEAAAAIRTTFATEWANRTVIEWPNDPIDPNPALGSWVRFVLQWGEGQRISIGKPAFHRIMGLVTIQVFVVQDIGEGGATRLCDAAASIFGDRVLNANGKIRFFSPSISIIGTDGVWWQQNTTINFTRDVVG